MGIEDIRLTRRSLLIATGATAVLAATPVRAQVSGVSDIRYIVTDRRYPHSLAHATALAAHGGRRLEVTEGLTRLWQESLQPLWQQREGAVAGLTTRAVWQCLAEQARSHGCRTRVLTPLTPSVDNDGHPENLVSWIIA